ncbi:MAG: hypothetical protein KF816_03145 [Melioribacteraceae bacterium]|nr:hypothetical protein [Melioribacteraceae bacterium]
MSGGVENVFVENNQIEKKGQAFFKNQIPIEAVLWKTFISVTTILIHVKTKYFLFN